MQKVAPEMAEKKSKKRKSKSKKIIAFDEEIVTKSVADKIISEENLKHENAAQKDNAKKSKKRKRKQSKDLIVTESNSDKSEEPAKKKKRKRKKNSIDETKNQSNNEYSEGKTNNNEEKRNGEGENLKAEAKKLSDNLEEPAKKKKRKRKKNLIDETNNQSNTEYSEGKSDKTNNNEESENLTGEAKRHRKKKDLTGEAEDSGEIEVTSEVPTHKKKRNANKPRDSLPLETQSELNPSKPSINKEESIRARKRRVHAELLERKRLHNEGEMQKKCLNYLSKWKHDRSGWKFEKLRQFWLTQNLWDDAKIPDEFFPVTVEYLESAKGKARDEVLKNALGIIDKENDGDDETKVKYERARMLVQSLQE